MITEMERISYILKKGRENGLTLKDFIELQIEEFEKSEEYKEMLVGERYFDNHSDIENKKRTYIDDNGTEIETKTFSNSKVKYPIVVKLINQKTGYLLKKEPTIKSENKDYAKILNDFYNKRKHKQLKNTMKQAIIKGICWWYVFVEDNKLKAKIRYANEIIPIWNDREHEELSAVIVRYYITNYTKLKGKEIIEKVEYHDLDGVRFFIRENGKLIEDAEKIEENIDFFLGKDIDGINLFANFKIDKTLMVWEKIPFVYFKYNPEEKPLLHYIKSLIDELEKLKSAVSDKLLDCVDGVDVVKNYGESAERFQKNLQAFKTVLLAENGEYKKEYGTIDITAFKEAMEQLRKDIISIGFGVDTESDKFGNQQSGVALQLLFEDLDLDCSNIETEFQSSLEYFMFFFNTFENIFNNKDYTNEEMEYIFNKSMITDDTEKIANVKNSEGVVSKKTQLANHPFVSNVDKELEQIEKENKESEEMQDDYSKLAIKRKNESSDVDEE